MDNGGSDGRERRKPFAPRGIGRFPLVSVPAPLAVLITIAMWAVAWWLRAELDAQLPPGFPFLTFFPVVIITSFLFGARVGALAALLCGVTAWYAFVPPKESFALSWGGWLAMGFYLLIVTTDLAIIHWMQSANRALAAEREANARLAETRELLFRELQHRVSNNLQMVAGLLNLQKRNVSDEAARLALDEASRRLGVIGRISRQLYHPDGAERGMSAFLDELANDVVDASGHGNVRIAVEASDDAPLDPDAAIPLALIVAEAVANSIEHGFAGQQAGAVDIRLARPARDTVTVEVEDDGKGLPAGFEIAKADSLGLQIATLLAAQLGGSFDLKPGARRGALARLRLPVAA